MALQFFDGFDHENVPLRGYLGIGLTGYVTGRSGTGFAVGSNTYWNVAFAGGTNTNTIYQGIAFIVPTPNGGSTMLFAHYLGGQVQNSVVLTHDMHIQVFRGDSGGTLLGTSTSTIPVNRWGFIEYAALDATAGTYEVRYNGTVILTGTGNTQSQASPGSDQHAFAFVNFAIDDYWCLDSSGSGPWNTYLGDRSAVIIRPSSDSSVTWSHSSGSSNFAMVNDAAPGDGDATYVSTATGSQLDLYGCQAVDSGDTIIAVQQLLFAKKTDATITQVQGAVNISSTTHLGSAVAVPDNYSLLVTTWEVSPATSAQWTAAEFNAATFGMESV